MNGFGDRDISHYMIPLCGTLSIADLGSIAHPYGMRKNFFTQIANAVGPADEM